MYKGLQIPIPMGQGGLHTDSAQSSIPPTSLIVANNVTLHNNTIRKMGGSARLNSTAIPNGVHAAIDFWATPTVADRRVVIVGGDGKTYAIDNAGGVTEITPTGVATVSPHNQVFMLAAGAETAGTAKKLFIFDGFTMPQIVVGTGATRSDLFGPPADWAGSNQPSFGALFYNRVIAGGNLNRPHTLYVSLSTNHQDFSAPGTAIITVYPGEGEYLAGAAIFKGRLYVYKYPYGVYYINTPDPTDPSTWYAEKVSSDFGFASFHCYTSAFNDVLIKDSSDRIISVSATNQFGDINAGDILNIMNIENYIKEQTNTQGVKQSHAIYYPERKTMYFTYRSAQGSTNDRMLAIRLETSGSPKATFITKDSPNCLALRKDSNLVDRPIYGSLDGYVYEMDKEDRNVNGLPYVGEFQTPHLDFGFLDPKLADLNKNFSHLSVRYVPQGNVTLFCDVIIDGKLYNTIPFDFSSDDVLADNVVSADDFVLANSATDPDGSFLSGEDAITLRKQLTGTGRTISFRFYNTGLNEDFNIPMIVVNFQPSGNQLRE